MTTQHGIHRDRHFAPRLLLLCAGLAAAVLFVLSNPARAATFTDVQVITTEPGPFFASALLCPTGSFEHAIELMDTGVPFRPPSPFDGQYPTLKALFNAPTVIASGTTSFVCDDGSGAFEFSWHGHGGTLFSEFSTGVAGRFHVSGGSGTYSRLIGEGTFSATVGPPGLIIIFNGSFSLR